MSPGVKPPVVESPSPATTLAILLGACTFDAAGDPTLSSPKLQASAERFRTYLTDRLGLARADQICYLFGADHGPEKTCQAIRDFLALPRSTSVNDVIVYYVGHGERIGDSYCLLLKHSQSNNYELSALLISQLKSALGGDVLHWRLHIIIDACFSGTAVDVYQSSSGESPSKVIRKNLPKRGISLLCSSNREHRSTIPAELNLSLFTWAMMEVLERSGDAGAGPKLSAQQVCELTKLLIDTEFAEKPGRPELYHLRHREKEASVGDIPFYPNPVCPLSDAGWEFGRLWEAGERGKAVSYLEAALLDGRPLSEADFVESLKLLVDDHAPLAVVPMYFALANKSSERVRDYAHNALFKHDWDRVRRAVIDRVARGDEKAAEILLDGLYASKTRKAEVDLLRTLTMTIPGPLRAKARRYFGEKELRLTDQAMRDRFAAAGERYRILESLGPGALTNAYLAVDTEESDGTYESAVVVRILHEHHAANPELVQQFLDRGRQTKRFKHTNLVSTYDVPRPKVDLCYSVHELAGRYTLRDELDRRAQRADGYPAENALLVLEAVALALTPFHRAGACHCGVRPGNVYLRPDQYPEVVLGDPSTILGPEFAPLLAIGMRDNVRLLEYMRYAAPETFSRVAGPAADFYSLGCLAYELWCGRPPFDDDNPFELFVRHKSDGPVPPTSRADRRWDSPFGPPGDRLVLRLMAKSPKDRYPDVAAVVDALRSLRPIPPGGPPGPEGDPPGPGGEPHSPSPGSGYPAPPADDQERLRAEVYRLLPSGVASAVADQLLHRLLSVVGRGDRRVGLQPFDLAPRGALRVTAGERDRVARSVVNLESDPVLTDEGQTFPVPRPTSDEPIEDIPHRSNAHPPQRIGRYEIRSRIGQGGMGKVFLAYDHVLARNVALKVIHREQVSPEMRSRFLREARVLARLQHPNICPVYELGQDEESGAPYIAMPLIQGRPLSEVIKRGLAIEDAVRIVRQVASAIHTAHEIGIVHRDLKPHNIMLTQQNVPIVLDFGIAHTTAIAHEEGLEPSILTSVRQFVGTPAYASPEQFAGDRTVTPASDIYSLGCILYEAVTGRLPYMGDNIAVILAGKLTSEPVPPQALRPDLPAALGRVIMRCLERDPTRRFGTARELAAALDQLVQL